MAKKEKQQPLPVVAMTPIQAAHLWDIVTKQHDPLACTIEGIQSWELIPGIWNGFDKEEAEWRNKTISAFLHEWADSFDRYVETRT